METWNEVYCEARVKCSKCRCCNVCNGYACKGETPGPGGKGNGASFIRNYEALQKIKLVMDTIVSNEDTDTSSDFFGHYVALPVYGAPISGIEQNYGAQMSDLDYTKALVEGCELAKSVAFTGDGMYDHMFKDPLEVLVKHGSKGVATIKPWDYPNMKWRIDEANAANLYAIASDVDASGLTNLRNSATPVGFKSVEDLKAIKATCKVPFIVKGIMSKQGALKALAANADGIIVSNHGGRVLDDSLAGIEVLEEIVEVCQGKMKIFVDGGFRTGNDIFKALALGADGVLIGRPISHAIIGGGAKGLKIYFDKLQLELKEAMAMCGCKSIKDITRDKVVVLK